MEPHTTSPTDSPSREPLVCQLPRDMTPLAAFERLCDRPHCMFLDSAQVDPRLGRYSYVAVDPFEFLTVPADGREALAKLARALASCPMRTIDGLPGFQGGAAGLLSYDLARSLERVPPPRCAEFDVPALAMGLYDTVIAFDHAQQQGWIIAQGWPEVTAQRRRERARRRQQELLRWLSRDPREVRPPARSAERLDLSRFAPQFPVDTPPGLLSNFSAAGYLQAVEAAIEYIRAGDVFQVNLAQRLVFPALDDAVSLYLRLRQRNPATFAAYFDLGEIQIVSASPERFLRVDHGCVETRPIKGTRPRTHRPEADLFSRDDLQQSEKDRAENVMIVDLLRNDLSRVCHADSVRVEQLCAVESYEYVQHLVSVIRGQLEPPHAAIDLVRAAFPGGSITGAPKVRAMEIIAELEPHARGAYCGSLGYLGADGAMDLSILIRTVTAARGWWQLPVGGGIVAQSDPRQEYAETWHKAEGLLRAVTK